MIGNPVAKRAFTFDTATYKDAAFGLVFSAALSGAGTIYLLTLKQWDIFVLNVIVAFPFLLCTLMAVYATACYRKQKLYCSNMRVVINEIESTMTIENTGKIKRSVVIPFDRIKAIHYISKSGKQNIGYKGKLISIETMCIQTYDNQVVYLGFFYKFFSYIWENRYAFPFSVELHPLCIGHHLPHNYNLVPELYDYEEKQKNMQYYEENSNNVSNQAKELLLMIKPARVVMLGLILGIAVCLLSWYMYDRSDNYAYAHKHMPEWSVFDNEMLTFEYPSSFKKPKVKSSRIDCSARESVAFMVVSYDFLKNKIHSSARRKKEMQKAIERTIAQRKAENSGYLEFHVQSVNISDREWCQMTYSVQTEDGIFVGMEMVNITNHNGETMVAQCDYGCYEMADKDSLEQMVQTIHFKSFTKIKAIRICLDFAIFYLVASLLLFYLKDRWLMPSMSDITGNAMKNN